MTYSQKVLDNFENPRNLGDLEQPDAQARIEHPVCGDIMQLAVKVSGDRISEVRFRTRGCIASIAAGSCLTELMKGKSIKEVRTIKREHLVEALGKLPNASIHATHLAMDVLAEVLGQLRKTG